MSADFWILTISIGITAIIMIPVMRWAIRTQREARRLADEGWICVDCHLFTGRSWFRPKRS